MSSNSMIQSHLRLSGGKVVNELVGRRSPLYTNELSRRDAFILAMMEELDTGGLLWVPKTGETTTSTDVSSNFGGKTITYSDSGLHLWGTRPVYLGNGYGLIFDGAGESASAADSADLSFAAADFSVLALVNPTDRTSNTILAKWDLTTAAEAKEYRFGFNSSDKLELKIHDESVASAQECTDTLDTAADVPEGSWNLLTATYDHSAEAVDMFKGSNKLTSTTVVGANYVAAEDLAGLFYIGAVESTAGAADETFNGRMAMCAVTNKILTIANIQAITRACITYYDMNL